MNSNGLSNKKIGFRGLALAAWLAGAAADSAVVSAVNNDFDGDRKADVAVYHPTTGNWYIQQSSNGGIRTQNWGWNEARPVLGDFDGDGRADPAVFHRQQNNWYILASSTGNLVLHQFGLPDARPVPGDYDGDGITDLAVYQRSTGNWLIRRSRDGSVYTVNWGWSEARPVPADYDGDGVTDVAVFHRATANWYIFGSRDGYMLKQWGWSQARPVPADYDGDRKADFAVYHPASGNWHVLGSASGQMYTVNWGFLQARPAPSDYDGDGRADIAVYHRDAGKWYIFRSHTADIRTEAFGSADMCAIPSYMNGGIQNLIILAFGDSITYGYSSSSGGPATGYPILMERICEPSLGGHCVVINGGKSGESTGDGRSRIRSLLSAHKPDLTLIMEGTNDEFFKVPYNTTESNLRSMVGSAKSAGSSVIISTIPPVIKSAYRDRTEQERLIEGFNPRISKIASSTDIQWVDTWKAITSVSNWQKDLMDQKTANHPNDAGYKVVRDTFFGGVKKGISSGLYY